MEHLVFIFFFIIRWIESKPVLYMFSWCSQQWAGSLAPSTGVSSEEVRHNFVAATIRPTSFHLAHTSPTANLAEFIFKNNVTSIAPTKFIPDNHG
jgi:hypothetical protein